MWVFGYGSLIWNPGFEFLDSKVGYIKGYVRRFWQGNDFHRGNPDKLGRVATLVEDKEGMTWGRAFLLGSEAQTSLSYLDSREQKLGGYCTTLVPFHPREEEGNPLQAIIYLALPSSHLYLGPAPLHQVALDIADARGHCGHNAEYLLRLADFMREQQLWDEHVYNLDHLVKARLKERSLSVEEVMGKECPLAVARMAGGGGDRRSPSPPVTSGFASRVPSRKLKCVNI